ncbi:Os01g0369950, partial [Oryza sativa Japonica Group]
KRVVRVAHHRIRGIERAPVILVQTCLPPEPLRQVRVGQEQPPVRHQVGVAVGDRLVAFVPVVPTVHHERAPERLPERKQAAVRDHRLAAVLAGADAHSRLDHVAVEDAEVVHEADHAQREDLRVGVVAVHVVGERGEAHPQAVRADLAGHRRDHLRGEAAPVLYAAAVRVGPVVDAVLHELVDQVTIGAVDLNPVETFVRK